jgi:hypothetical protein
MAADVTDDRHRPHLAPPLRIIDAITSSWGHDPRPLGKHVWAELESRQPDGTPRSAASGDEGRIREGPSASR